MKRNKVQLDTWPRREHYLHFTKAVNCSSSITHKIEVTELLMACQAKHVSFYICFLYCICKVINAHEEFRLYHQWQTDELYVWDCVSPSQLVFHEDDQTFTRIWTEWNPDFEAFYMACQNDITEGKTLRGYSVHEAPDYLFDTSCLPWLDYSSINLNIPKDWIYLAPIITWGQYSKGDDKSFLSLTMQIHHAAADGFHIARFFREVEEACRSLNILL